MADPMQSPLHDLRRGLHATRYCPSCHAPVLEHEKRCAKCGRSMASAKPFLLRTAALVRPLFRLALTVALLGGLAVGGLAAYVRFLVLAEVAPAIRTQQAVRLTLADGRQEIGRVTQVSTASITLERADGSPVRLEAGELPVTLRIRIDETAALKFSLRTALKAMAFRGGRLPPAAVAVVREELRASSDASRPPFPVTPGEITRLAESVRSNFVLAADGRAGNYAAGRTVEVWQASGVVLTGVMLAAPTTGLVVRTESGVKTFPFAALAFEQRCAVDEDFAAQVATVRSVAFARAAYTNVGCVPPAPDGSEEQPAPGGLRIGDPVALFAAARLAESRRHPAEAFLLYEAAATGGNPEAMRLVGQKYLTGEGVRMDADRGRALLEASKQGLPPPPPPEKIALVHAPPRPNPDVFDQRPARVIKCETCEGIGKLILRSSNGREIGYVCPVCGGHGRHEINANKENPVCTRCGGMGHVPIRGTGRITAQKCQTCLGTGALPTKP